MRESASYYDREANIVWIPTGASDAAVSEETSWGLVDHDASSDAVVGIEIWNARKIFPADLLDALPEPERGAS